MQPARTDLDRNDLARAIAFILKANRHLIPPAKRLEHGVPASDPYRPLAERLIEQLERMNYGFVQGPPARAHSDRGHR